MGATAEYPKAEPMDKYRDQTLPQANHKGQLTVVGTGIQAISQMTVESLSYIEAADVVFFHATNGVTASHILSLNPNAIDLYAYYGEDKKRTITYIQMAELMLSEVRRGKYVVGVFYGHPGYFVSPARRALAIAAAEGYATMLLPGVSATDCLFADLRIDPGVGGCQVLMASKVLSEDCVLATNGHVVFLQINAVGDATFSFSGYKETKFTEFIRRLIQFYGETQDACYYMAAVLPGFAPEIWTRSLGELVRPEVRPKVGSGVLYLPPKGVSVDALTSYQAFKGRVPYGRREAEAIASLEAHRLPRGFLLRRASAALLKAFSDIGSSALAREAFNRDPDLYLASYADLRQNERDAIASRKVAAVRRVTTWKAM